MNWSSKKLLTPKQFKQNVAVSAPHSREWQDMLAKSSNASGQFVASEGGEFNSDDWFISTERSNRIVTVKELEKEKKLFKEAKNVISMLIQSVKSTVIWTKISRIQRMHRNNQCLD